MNPKDCFDTAYIRAEHFLTLYKLLHDTRARRIRSDWADRFKDLMRWPQGENIVRIDGENRNSILILREEVGIDRNQFTHEYMSELLRSAIVAVVSAFDRYLHDQVVSKSWGLLQKKEDDIPKELTRIKLPVLATKRALDKLRRDEKSRPGYIVKQAIQENLHREYTFQNPSNVVKACQMLGVNDLWTKVSAEMPGNPQISDVISKLKSIVDRRNKIVHEADLTKKIKIKKVSLRKITLKFTVESVYWIRDLVEAIDIVITQSTYR